MRRLTGGEVRATRPTEGNGKLGKRAVGDAGPYAPYETSIGRDDVGSELSAASGRSSEVSEWPRSKFPASAVRQHRNFGHRNRIIGPYGSATRGAMGGRPQGSPLRKRYKGCGKTGRRGRPPLRILCNTNFCNKKGMPVKASLLSFYAGAIALARVCAYSISRRFDCLASWVTLGRISSRTPLSYLALILAVSMPATLKLRL